MTVKKFFSWLIVGAILLAVSAFLLAGDLIKSDIVSPRKPELMKEKRQATKIVGQDIFTKLDGKQTKIGRIEAKNKTISIFPSKSVSILTVKLTGFAEDVDHVRIAKEYGGGGVHHYFAKIIGVLSEGVGTSIVNDFEDGYFTAEAEFSLPGKENIQHNLQKSFVFDPLKNRWTSR